MDQKQIKPVLSFPVIINKQKWSVRLYSNADYDTMYPGTVGMTEYLHHTGLRTISFNSKPTRDTVAHEIMHAYASYYDFSRKKYHVIEEKFCEIIGKKHKPLFNLTNKVYRKLTRKLGRKR